MTTFKGRTDGLFHNSHRPCQRNPEQSRGIRAMRRDYRRIVGDLHRAGLQAHYKMKRLYGPRVPAPARRDAGGQFETFQ
jgi:hypothetical protein